MAVGRSGLHFRVHETVVITRTALVLDNRTNLRFLISSLYSCQIYNPFDAHLPQRPQMQPQIHLQVLSGLSLDLVCEVEITLVKLVHSDVTILSSTGVSLSLWIGCDSV